jgi:hypothetical protein
LDEADQDEAELDALEGRPASETHDVGCIEFDNSNLNTRIFYPGGTDIYMFSVCAEAPRPKLGIGVGPLKNGATVVVTDPNGDNWQPDSRHSDDNWGPKFVGPPIQGDYLVEVVGKGGGGVNYNMSVSNNYYPGSDYTGE